MHPQPPTSVGVISRAAPPRRARLDALDVFRGLTVVAMILVNTPGDSEVSYGPLRHAEWNGCTPTDWIFPFFLFIVGVAMSLSLPRRRERGESDRAILTHALRRSLILFAIGLLYNTFPFTHFDLATFRIPGVLQRIAFCYLIATIFALKAGVRGLLAGCAVILIGHWAVLSLISAPGQGVVELTQDSAPAGLGAYLDRLLLGRHLGGGQGTWDEKGLLSSCSASVSTLLGVVAGHVLGWERSARTRIGVLLGAGVIAALLGWAWGGCPRFVGLVTLGEPRFGGFPINRPLSTGPYVLFTSGLGAVGLAGCYWLVDVRGYKAWALPFIVFGMNAILAFMLSGMVAHLLLAIPVRGAAPSLYATLYRELFAPLASPEDASLLFAACSVLVLFGVMAILHRKRIFLKV